jgi:hypothetical protein
MADSSTTPPCEYETVESKTRAFETRMLENRTVLVTYFAYAVPATCDILHRGKRKSNENVSNGSLWCRTTNELRLKEANVIGQKRGGKQRNSGTRQVDRQIERYVKSLLAIKKLERPFTNL